MKSSWVISHVNVVCVSNLSEPNWYCWIVTGKSMWFVIHSYSLFLGAYMFWPMQPSSGRILWVLCRASQVFTHIYKCIVTNLVSTKLYDTFDNKSKKNVFSDPQVNVHTALFCFLKTCFNTFSPVGVILLLGLSCQLSGQSSFTPQSP
jgi:hypothetical protein